MKKLPMASFAAMILVLGTVATAVPGTAAAAPSGDAGYIMVKFRDGGAGVGVLRQHGLSEGPDVGSTGAHLIAVPAGQEQQLMDALSRNPVVEYAEPDQPVTASSTDQYFPRQYALQNDGQAFTNTKGDIQVAAGTPDADVD
ncbi:MAG: peptidase S8, partial [Pseudarthrobacter sp.]